MKMFGLQPSKEVGLLKTSLKDAILDGVISNNYDEALNFLIAKAESMGLKPIL